MAYNPPLIHGPIAPENNPPIEPQFFQPSAFQIAAIALGASTTITTSVDHNYVVGQLVRLTIPQPYGSYQLSEQQGYVTSIPAADQVVLNINSTNANAFIPTIAAPFTLPQIMAIGNIENGTINANGRVNNGTTTPGAFINVSPFLS